MDAWERISGCLVGFARGERVGCEARARASGSAFDGGSKPAMARAIMGGLSRPARFDPRLAREGLLAAWRSQGAKSNSVSLTKSLQDDALLRTTPYAGNSSYPDGGDAALVRSFPAAIAGMLDPDHAAFAACAQARLTHAGPISVQAAELFVRILRDALLGMGHEALRDRPWVGCQAIAGIASGAWRKIPSGKLGSRGEAVRTLNSALWAVDDARDLAHAIERAAGLPGHSDAIACLAGALAGAIHGAGSEDDQSPFPDAAEWVRSCLRAKVAKPGPRPADIEDRNFASARGLQPLTYAGELWIRTRIEAGHAPNWEDGAYWFGNYGDPRSSLAPWAEGVRVFAGEYPRMVDVHELSEEERLRGDQA